MFPRSTNIFKSIGFVVVTAWMTGCLLSPVEEVSPAHSGGSAGAVEFVDVRAKETAAAPESDSLSMTLQAVESVTIEVKLPGLIDG